MRATDAFNQGEPDMEREPAVGGPSAAVKRGTEGWRELAGEFEASDETMRARYVFINRRRAGRR